MPNEKELSAKERVLLRYPEARCSESLPVVYAITTGRSPFFEAIAASEPEAWEIMASKVDHQFAESLADSAKTTGDK